MVVEAKVTAVVGCKEEARRLLALQVGNHILEKGFPNAVALACGINRQKCDFPGRTGITLLEKLLREDHFGSNRS
jgi:hypothetical protein